MAEGAVPSPCTKVCTMDDRADICVGCGRTLGEIAEWGLAAAPRQRVILRDAAARLAVLHRD